MSLKSLQYLDGQPRRAVQKPPRGSRKRAKGARDRAHRLTRSTLRSVVYRADEGRCRHCHCRVWLKLREAPHELLVANVHEWVPKSLGGDDLDPTNCITLCGRCHPLFTEHRLEIVAHDALRLMRGLVDFITGGNPLRRRTWRRELAYGSAARRAVGADSGRSRRRGRASVSADTVSRTPCGGPASSPA